MAQSRTGSSQSDRGRTKNLRRTHNQTSPASIFANVSNDQISLWEDMELSQQTYPCSERKLKVVGPEGIVFDGYVDDFVQKRRFTEEIFGDPKPEAKELRAW